MARHHHIFQKNIPLKFYIFLVLRYNFYRGYIGRRARQESLEPRVSPADV